ncbi:STE/STE7/MEK1 protein kinase [Microbotryum lychnidis-dioicae p1A1 Lamole]|uniref:STE/STE7/MEK1 protein kinase n=1 Tax=Microbotryum lychnidis-dioicae (strain p1A1 Lamole / MvSl-1064) TaxID=683840 RepID=U5HBV2_USTV1|nr:STE/STE7/MEK1 protein kinase [Microbotryum lychnidis-dioicae p1A1 Lamole]|eukprot:KDE04998.1 STE/STE7/MEK1 protein kinase [Microbotryum lychnidis-dioicae p1A1 Lamole]
MADAKAFSSNGAAAGPFLNDEPRPSQPVNAAPHSRPAPAIPVRTSSRLISSTGTSASPFAPPRPRLVISSSCSAPSTSTLTSTSTSATAETDAAATPTATTPTPLSTRKNRNKKGLALTAEAAKPGTLSNTSAAELLSAGANDSSSTRGATCTGGGESVATRAPQSSKTSAPVQVSGSSRTTSRRSIASSATSASSSASSPLLPITPGGLSASSLSSTASGVSMSQDRERYQNRLSEQLATLELGVEFKLDLRTEDLEVLEELGSGNGGTVTRCRHVPTQAIMAKKVVHIATSATTRKQILRELQIMHDCSSPFIVSFYGAYLRDPYICMCMEYMDKGSLDQIYKRVGPIPEPILGKIALAVVSGLTYLYDVHKIMHRDVKPSNVLLNSAGQIKICDFGVSGELINSIADTFVGTSTYMSPERISGDPYTVKSDVWSLGITLVELAIGRFPFASDDGRSDDDSDDDEVVVLDKRSARLARIADEDYPGDETLSPVRPEERAGTLEAAEQKRVARRKAGGGSVDAAVDAETDAARNDDRKRRSVAGVSLAGSGHQMSILELLQYIVNEPAPSLPANRFSPEAQEFVNAMLRKEPIGWNVKKKGPLPKDLARPTPKELLEYKWLVDAMASDTDVEAFARTIP